VIGGGDWSEDRLIPDAIAAFMAGLPLMIRNPLAIRPWQHVLEPLAGYLVLAQALYGQKGAAYNGAWNFGPSDTEVYSVQEVIELLINKWDGPVSWRQDGSPAPHEANFLKLDCSKSSKELGWRAHWSLEEAIEAIVSWQRVFNSGGDILNVMHKQIDRYSYSSQIE
jgi:CDP-glucose 4,6-dehydratase